MSNLTSESSDSDSDVPPPRRVVVRRSPCVVCEHLRRRCRRNCPYAQEFPGERPTCLDTLCEAFGTQQAIRMLGALNRERWVPAANSQVHNSIVGLRNRENEAFEIITRLQNQVIDLQISNTFMRNQLSVRRQPRLPPLSIYDLMPNNAGPAGVNEPFGRQIGGPPASGPGEGSIPPGGRQAAPRSSENNKRPRIGPP